MLYKLKDLISEGSVFHPGFKLVELPCSIPIKAAKCPTTHIVSVEKLSTKELVAKAQIEVTRLISDLLVGTGERSKLKETCDKYLYACCSQQYVKSNYSMTYDRFKKDKTIFYYCDDIRIIDVGVAYHNGGKVWFEGDTLFACLN